jgi:hypothetical protein
MDAHACRLAQTYICAWQASADGIAGLWRETHLLDFLRRTTDLSDAQVIPAAVCSMPKLQLVAK